MLNSFGGQIPWRSSLRPQLGGLKTSLDGVVWPITKLTSPRDACAPNESRYEVGDSRPESVTVQTHINIVRRMDDARLVLDGWCLECILTSQTVARRVAVNCQVVCAAHGAVAMTPVPDQRVLSVWDLVLFHLELPRHLLALDLGSWIAGIPALRLVAIPLFDVGVGRRRGRRRRRRRFRRR